ncbi:MAG: hypothetical protein JW745_07460 [Sedimentisphaerales bacterium]|nr:hypothetical protein [Sedimentisphaerales bacterium]MBN2843677.1 hypothetical protein [Sedimentisphaerales bacterium]
MNIFKRKNKEHDPYMFDPTRSSVSLAIVFFMTVALAWLFVQSKARQTNTIELLASFNQPGSGLSEYIPAEPQDNYYLLTKDGQPIGFTVEHIEWQDQHLTGSRVLAIPDQAYFQKSLWRVANNYSSLAEHTTTSDPQGSIVDIISLNNGILSIVKNRTKLLEAPLPAVSYYFVPAFFADYITSIGLDQYPKGLAFDLDLVNDLSCEVTITGRENIPPAIVALDQNGTAALSLCGELEMLQYFSSDHKLLYQKFNTNKLLFEITEISDYETIIAQWPQAQAIIPKSEQPVNGATEI